MEFCSKCGGIMQPEKLKTKTVISCRNCGKRRDVKKNESIKVKESVKHTPDEDVMIMEKNQELSALPKTKTQCPECDHGEAHWWLQQTRSVDESPTRFYACAECSHRWREYD